MKQQMKIILAGMVGNALEFYDFSLYGFFAPLIAHSFFPSEDKVASLIYTLGIFAVGFFMRPLGAIFFGYIGDRYGRKRALSLSVIMMAVPTTLIGLLPSYAMIGVAAPIILTLCRLMQGLCTGGEYNGAAIFVLEHQKNNRGLAGGLITSSCAIGALMGTGAGLLATRFEGFLGLETWRLPFLAGILIGFVGMYIRRKLDESPVFQEALRQKSLGEPEEKIPLLQALKKHRMSVLCVIGIAWLNGVMYYASFQYVPVYLNTAFGWSLSDTLPMASVAIIVYAIGTPLSGALSDRIGVGKIMRPAAIAIAILAFPLFWMISTAYGPAIVIAQILFALLAALFSGPINVMMQYLFPVEDRYSGIAFSYSIGMALFGGFTPMIMTILLREMQWNLAPAIWILLSGLAAAIVLNVVYPRIVIAKE